MRTVQELKTLINVSEEELLVLKRELHDAMLVDSKYAIGAILKHQNKGDAKIIKLQVGYGNVNPIVVYKKKNGEWGAREFTPYSWDLKRCT